MNRSAERSSRQTSCPLRPVEVQVANFEALANERETADVNDDDLLAEQRSYYRARAPSMTNGGSDGVCMSGARNGCSNGSAR